jgi:hypothetical protein
MADLLAMLRGLWFGKPPTCRRVRLYIKRDGVNSVDWERFLAIALRID